MNEGDLLREALKVGPLVAAMGLVVWVLWRKLEAKDTATAALTREVLGALSANTAAMGQMASAIDGLRDAITDGGHRAPRRAGGAD